MKHLLLVLLCASSAAFLASACNDSNDVDCSPFAADEEPTLQLCDITTARCQCQVYKWVSVQRGTDLFEPPITNSITREAYQAALNNNGEGSEGEQEIDAFGEVLRLVGYNNSEQSFSDDESDTRGSGVAAFYSTSSESVTIITDEDTSSSNARAVTLLAHEYTHAQQDTEEYFDYLNSRILDADMLLSARATLEGEAELIEIFATFALENVPRDQWDWEQQSDELQMLYVERALEEDNPYPLANLIFPYPYGAEMFASSYFGVTQLARQCFFARESEEEAAELTDTLQSQSEFLRASALRLLKIADQFGGDYRDVREQRCAFPTQSRQLLTERYGRDARADGYVDQIQPTFSEPALPDGLEIAQSFRPMGAWHYFLYLQFAYPDDFDAAGALDAVADLHGDRLYTVKDSDGETLFGGWWFYMNDALAAEVLSDILIENPDESSEQWSVFVDGPHVVLTVGQESNAEWRAWMNDLPSLYDEFLNETASTRPKSIDVPDRDRPQLPERIY